MIVIQISESFGAQMLSMTGVGDATVTIVGPSGSGKAQLAERIREQNPNAFVIECQDSTATRFESTVLALRQP